LLKHSIVHSNLPPSIVENPQSCLLKNATPEDKLLFVCTRQNFTVDHQQIMVDLHRQYELDWEYVFQIASMHGVAPLVCVNLRQNPSESLGIPQEIIDQFQRALMVNMFFKEKLAKNLAEGLSFFEDRSIKVMLIKGGVLDVLVYDQPYHTVLSDIDLVLKLRRDDVPEETWHEFMRFFHQKAIEYDYFEHHDVSMNGILPINFQTIWNDATRIEYKGFDVLVMCPEDMLITLCVNSCRKRFFRLKSLGDIAETIGKYPNLDWEKVSQRARDYDCGAIVYTALFVTKITVGCDLPDEFLDTLSVNSVRKMVIQQLVRRMSLSAFSALYTGKKMLNRSIDGSLMLPYLTMRWYQIGRRIRFVLSSPR